MQLQLYAKKISLLSLIIFSLTYLGELLVLIFQLKIQIVRHYLIVWMLGVRVVTLVKNYQGESFNLNVPRSQRINQNLCSDDQYILSVIIT